MNQPFEPEIALKGIVSDAEWTQERRELLHWFRQNATLVADMYEAAVWLQGAPTFPSRLYLLAHAVREILDRLVFSLDPQLPPRRTQYDHHADEIAAKWHFSPANDATDKPDAPVSVPFRTAHAINALVKYHEAKRAQPSNVELLLAYLYRRENDAPISERLISSFEAVQEWFGAYAHMPSRVVSRPSEDELRAQFDAFEAILHGLVGNYFTGRKAIDYILRQVTEDKPAPELVTQAVNRLSSPQHESYFFSRLDNPLWIGPLADTGYFNAPPEVQTFPNGLVRSPQWPPTKYLARMANQAPEEVAELFDSMRTDNPAIIGDMLDAALAMPIGIGVRLAEQVTLAAQRRLLWFHHAKAYTFAAKLVDAGEHGKADRLARDLLHVQPSSDPRRPSNLDFHGMREGLKVLTPAFLRQVPKEYVQMLGYQLRDAVCQRAGIEHSDSEDRSEIWRPAIEDHEHNHDHGAPSVFVDAIRDAINVGIVGQYLTVSRCIEILGTFPQTVFRRLALYVIAQHGAPLDGDVGVYILDHLTFDDVRLKHEYAELLGARWPQANHEQQALWLAWVAAGPDHTILDRIVQSRFERLPTDEERAKWIDHWRLEKLYLVRMHLQGAAADQYQGLLAQYGVPELAEFYMKTTTSWGDRSPFTLEDLEKIPFEEAFERVVAWRPAPNTDPTGPSITGATHVLRRLMAKDPLIASRMSGRLKHAPAVYVRAYVEAMSDALKANQTIDVAAVLEVCRAVVSGELEGSSHTPLPHEVLVDRSTEWTRQQISRLIETLCSSLDNGVLRVGVEHRKELWEIASSLLEQAEPTVPSNPGYDPRNTNHLGTAINSTAGRAMEAVLEYSHWVARHLSGMTHLTVELKDGLNNMPEVRHCLDRFIGRDERDLGAMTIIGSHIGLLWWIDKHWLGLHARQMFRLDRDDISCDGWGAWNAYVSSVRAHRALFDLFREQFEVAVQQAAQVRDVSMSPNSPLDRLGEHLAVMYAQGHIVLDGGLLQEFLTVVKSPVRIHVIEHAGNLRGSVDVPLAVLQRLMTLWEQYWTKWGREDARTSPDAWLFGAWFAWSLYPAEWALRQLDEFSTVVAIPEPDHAVAEKLAELVDHDLARSVLILSRMIEGDVEGWHVHGWADEAKQVLRKGLMGPAPVRQVASDALNRLGRRGFSEFGELMPKEPGS